MFEAYQGMPYVLVGPTCIYDCSGLWYLFPESGINIPKQHKLNTIFQKKIDEKDFYAGDLVFFIVPMKHLITHLGMYMGNGMMYHAGDPLQYTV